MLNEYFSPEISDKLDQYINIQEIRIRLNQNITVLDALGLNELDERIGKQELLNIFSSLCSFSVYAKQQEIKNGFITLPEGHRVGICGRCVVENGKISNISNITSLNIRIAREFLDCSKKIYNEINNNIDHTVIISPPNCGKTTYLRDLTRLFSNSGKNVSVVDERGEIAPFAEENHFDLGKNTDVLQYCPKDKGLMLVLRTMNPEIIVTDEIGTNTDAEAVSEITKSGVIMVTSFHGSSIEDFKERFPKWYEFKYAVFLNKQKKVDKIICLR